MTDSTSDLGLDDLQLQLSKGCGMVTKEAFTDGPELDIDLNGLRKKKERLDKELLFERYKDEERRNLTQDIEQKELELKQYKKKEGPELNELRNELERLDKELLFERYKEEERRNLTQDIEQKEQELKQYKKKEGPELNELRNELERLDKELLFERYKEKEQQKLKEEIAQKKQDLKHFKEKVDDHDGRKQSGNKIIYLHEDVKNSNLQKALKAESQYRNKFVFCEIKGLKYYTKTNSQNCKNISPIYGDVINKEEKGNFELVSKLDKLHLLNVEKGDGTNQKVQIQLFSMKKTDEVLGKGGIAGDVKVVKNEKGEEKAVKFLNKGWPEEVLAMIDISSKNYKICPEIYCIVENKEQLQIFMEKISPSFTLRELIDNQIGDIFQNDAVLGLKLMSFISISSLLAVDTIHSLRWCHRDINAKNILLQSVSNQNIRKSYKYELLVRVIDFGKALFTDDYRTVDYKSILTIWERLAVKCEKSEEGRAILETFRRTEKESDSKKLERLTMIWKKHPLTQEDVIKVTERLFKLSTNDINTTLDGMPQNGPDETNSHNVDGHEETNQFNGAHGEVRDDKVTSASSDLQNPDIKMEMKPYDLGLAKRKKMPKVFHPTDSCKILVVS